VTMGAVWAGSAARKQAPSGDVELGQFLLGASELLASLVALTLLNMAIRAAFERYGERVDEQIFIQHLCALPLFMVGGQWHSKILSRALAWARARDAWRAMLLMVNVLCTSGDRAASIQVTGRAPSLLVGQLVQTLKRFLNVFVTALLCAPPLPDAGFWAGALLLVLGTAQFLSASNEIREDKHGDVQETDRKER